MVDFVWPRKNVLLCALITLIGLWMAGNPHVAASSSIIVFSEFRVRGPNGGSDEFVELYNLSGAPVNIGGWKINGSNNAGVTSTRVTIAPNTLLNPGCHFLATNSSASGGPYSGSVPGDQTYSTGITDDGGVALIDASGSIVDQVGLSAGSAYKEGTQLAPLGSTNINRSYERKPGDGLGSDTDTDDNAADFRLLTPSDPQNLSSPCIVLNGPTAVGSADPASVDLGGSTTLTVVVALGNPPTPIASVVADLTSIGGAASAAFTQSGPFTYILTTTVGGAAGMKAIPVLITEQPPTSRVAGTTIVVAAAPPFHSIHEIQGAGNLSPFAGQPVRTEGVVTALKRGSGGGFFIQTPDVSVDADPATSEGIFVFTSSVLPAEAAVGNLVSVSAAVQEFRPASDPSSPTSTELIAPLVTILSTGNPLPAPVTLTAVDTDPRGSPFQLERFEGMRVSVPLLTVVSPTQGTISEQNATSTSNGVFYGVLLGIARPFREPGIDVLDALPTDAPPNVPRFDTNPERIRIDTAGQLGARPIEVTSGATVSDLVGVLDFGFRTYSVLVDATAAPTIGGNIAARPVPPALSGQFTIATANIERFFDTVDDAGTSDVVLTPAAFATRLNKTSLVIHNILRCPDIIGFEEVEHQATLAAVAEKVNRDPAGGCSAAPKYVAYLEEGNDIGGIDVGFLVNEARVTVVDVTQVGKDETYTQPDGTTAILNDRPPLILRARLDLGMGFVPADVTVIANHLRSLSGINDPLDGPRVREKRRAQAEFLAKLVQTRQAENPAERIAVLGDFNAFAFNDGYVDTMGTVMGRPTPADQVVLASSDLVDPDLVDLGALSPPADRYSFLFDGNAQELDHILVTSNLARVSASVSHGRTNADFPESFRGDSTRPERVSDHDPLVAYFNFVHEPRAALTVTPDILWPPNHKMTAVTVVAKAIPPGDPTLACAIQSIESSEPDDGLGDGDTPLDVSLGGGLTALLRAERGGGGPGRTYTIDVRCTDTFGNHTDGSVVVKVPHSR
jgi:uncharacterized protein